MKYEDVLHFWFKELTPQQWFEKNEVLDQKIKELFFKLHTQAHAGELYTWRKTPQGRLAEIIVLDQFSRNIFRGRPESFASDAIAVVLAQEAMGGGSDRELPIEQRSFLYMPFMHSESLEIHKLAMQVYDQKGLEYNLEYEKKHMVIIERFGRYPHRNKILGRTSTLEEIEFLKGPDSSF